MRGVFVISNSQKESFLSVFDDFDSERVFVTPNGINPNVFQVDAGLVRDEVLAHFPTKPYEGSSAEVTSIPTGSDSMVLFVGKFADIKRIDCLLQAAVAYEKALRAAGQRVITVIAGSGPVQEQRLYQDMALRLGLSDIYFIGPHAQPALARLYNVADAAVFPTKFEAFGLVFLECIACGTPVIGTAAGGPLEFVDESVGALVTDFDSNDDFAKALGETITRSLLEDWKPAKTAAAVKVASRYTLTVQCERILGGVDSLAAL